MAVEEDAVTDLDRLHALLESWGVAHRVEDSKIYIDTNPRAGFYIYFVFDEDGSFQDVGAWE